MLIHVPVLAKVYMYMVPVYLVHLQVEHCQTLRVVSTFTGQYTELAVLNWWNNIAISVLIPFQMVYEWSQGTKKS